MTRTEWQKAWRQMRIMRRESSKASRDAMMYGIGWIEIGPNIPDGIRHVAADQVYERIPQAVAAP